MIHERAMFDHGSDEMLVREHLARYRFASQYISSKSVLDVACGAGYGAALLKEEGASRVTGIDISEEAVNYAKEHHGQNGVDFAVGSAEQLALSDKYNTIVSFETIEHLNRPELFLERTTQLLENDGVLIISTPVREKGTLDTRPINPFHIREWSLMEFEKLLQRYYSNVTIYGQYYFKKMNFPFSRTIQKFFFILRYPGSISSINSFSVLSKVPVYDGFSFSMIRIIAVCEH